MTEEQLHLLRASRLSGQDRQDPAVAAALAAASQDAEVLAMLEADRRTDMAMQEALRGKEPPGDFESAMLTAMRAARGLAEPPPNLEKSVLSAVQLPTVTDRPRSRRQWLAWSAAAAAAVAAGGVWWWRKSRPFSMQRLSEELAGITRKGVTLSLTSMDRGAIAGWMRDHGAPRSGSLPPKLDALGRKGCHLYEIAGHPVSLECLLLPGMRLLHLFTTPAADLTDAPADGAPAAVSVFDGRTLATWTRGGFTSLLFTDESVDEVRPLLA